MLSYKSMKKLTKIEAQEKIKDFFETAKHSEIETKKIKKLAMHYNIKLGKLRKRFCKKCYSSLDNASVRIRNKTKIAKCKKCGHVSRWKIKS